MVNWFRSINWRRVMAIAPLPALGLAASYGVFRFALMFVPAWVAFVQAASFELTYIGLAVVDGLTPEQRKRAQYIGMGAVVVSVLYNSLDGFFHLRPSALESPPRRPACRPGDPAWPPPRCSGLSGIKPAAACPCRLSSCTVSKCYRKP